MIYIVFLFFFTSPKLSVLTGVHKLFSTVDIMAQQTSALLFRIALFHTAEIFRAFILKYL